MVHRRCMKQNMNCSHFACLICNSVSAESRSKRNGDWLRLAFQIAQVKRDSNPRSPTDRKTYRL